MLLLAWYNNVLFNVILVYVLKYFKKIDFATARLGNTISANLF